MSREPSPLRPGTRDLEAQRIVSSFSDLRYYTECPHDFYLRKVLGFAPTIDQAFGYGRGVSQHNAGPSTATLPGGPSLPMTQRSLTRGFGT